MMVLSLAACGSSSGTGSASASGAAASGAPSSSASGSTGVEDGVLTVAMECAYAPYNWSQPDNSNGAVPIKDSNEFANGYDVMRRVCGHYPQTLFFLFSRNPSYVA